MVKEISEKFCFIALWVVWLVWGVNVAPFAYGAPILPTAPTIPQLWTLRMSGAISDISVSKSGKVVLVATSPDRDIVGSAHFYLLSLLSEKGKLLWRRKMKSPVKDQDVSEDGKLIVVSNYENEMIGLDSKGQTLWTVEGMCRPRILNHAKKILCYHDDDNEPHIGFDVFDWSGKKDLSFPITQDILALKLSQDEKNLAIALEGGAIIFIDAQFKSVWQKKVEGEVVDLAVSSGDSPRVAVLFTPREKISEKSRDKLKEKNQKLVVFDSVGKQLLQSAPSFRSIQLDFDPDGKSIYYYGNCVEGQHLGSFSLTSKSEAWKRGGDIASDYSSSIIVSSSMVLMGYEEILPTSRSSHLLAFDATGAPKWDLPLATDLGAYLYSEKVALGPLLLVVGTDDGRISAYRMN